ncbi:hypothetical protein A7K93_00330 [Candidatus Methylacidiphilum fumarolicum]|nr:hypothetical protein A7K93_00330 [Candidatus Methylacidiphilum fumarolicum]
MNKKYSLKKSFRIHIEADRKLHCGWLSSSDSMQEEAVGICHCFYSGSNGLIKPKVKLLSSKGAE